MNIVKKDNRLLWIDVAKGIGIILVVFGHVLRGLDAANILIPNFKTIDKLVYSFHMPLFFFLSGYFFVKSFNKGPKDFINSKFSTLLYPYLVWSLIQIVVQFILSNFINGKVSLSDVFTFFYPRGQFWFLFALILFNLLNYWMYSKFRLKGILLLILLSFLFFIFIQMNDTLLHILIFNIVFFNGGILFLEYKIDQLLLQNKNRLIYVLSIVLFGLLMYFYLILGISFFLFKFLLGSVGVIAVIMTSHLVLGKFYILSYLGEKSMVIYLLHILCGSGSRILVMQCGVQNPYVYVCVGMIIGIGLPIMLYELILKKYFMFLFKPTFKISF